MKAILLRRAEADIEAITAFMANESSGLAVQFIDAYSTTIDLLVRRPGIGHVHVETRAKGLREIRCVGIEQFSNYLLFYRVHGDVIQIVRVVHGARDIAASVDLSAD